MDFVFKESYDINDLLRIMEILRSENGCPWDRGQDHKSIRKDFLEEVYEVCEAIDLEDSDLLKEELGDVLLQVVFHARIEEEQGRFCFGDSVNDVCRKLIIRHPHVFGEVKVADSSEVLKNWNDIKQKTKGQQTYTETLRSVCKALPSLMRAQKLSKRAVRAGMDVNADTAAERIGEELERVMTSAAPEERERALGDMLFAAAELAGALGCDAEEALTKASDRFTDRFEDLEKNGML